MLTSFPSSICSNVRHCLATKLFELFSMPHASEYHPLSRSVFAAPWDFHDAWQITGRSTSTWITWYACACDEALSGHILLPHSALSPAQFLLTTQQTSPNQAYQWPWFFSRYSRGSSLLTRLVSREGLLSLPILLVFTFLYTESNMPVQRLLKRNLRLAPESLRCHNWGFIQYAGPPWCILEPGRVLGPFVLLTNKL